MDVGKKSWVPTMCTYDRGFQPSFSILSLLFTIQFSVLY